MALSVNRPLTYHIFQLMCRARRRPRVQRLRWHRRAPRPPSCVATYHGRRRMLAVAPSGTHGRAAGRKRRSPPRPPPPSPPPVSRRGAPRRASAPAFLQGAPSQPAKPALAFRPTDPLNSAPAGVPRPTPAGDKPDRRRPLRASDLPLAAPVCLVAEDASPAVLGMANYSIALLGTREKAHHGCVLNLPARRCEYSSRVDGAAAAADYVEYGAGRDTSCNV